MSLAGIVFGVSFFIVTQAQTSGFEDFFIRTIWGTNGAVRVQDQFQHTVTTLVAEGEGDAEEQVGFAVPLREGRSYIEGIQQPRQVMEAVWEFEEVAGAAEVIRGNARITSGFRTQTTEVRGIHLNQYLSVSDLANQVRYGELQTYAEDPHGILIGTLLAERLAVDVGDSVRLQGVDEARRYRIGAIFETGVEEFDKARVFIPLRESRILLNRPTTSSFIQINLIDNDHADRVAAHMQETLNHHVVSWKTTERTWLEVFRALRFSSGITMSVIILIAGLGMFNTLAMIVMERQREIAILRSMGYSRRDIVNIFLSQGAIVLALGTLIGWAFAVLFTMGVESVPIRIRGIIATDHFMVHWSFWHYISAALIASAVVFVASYIPARRAARLEPGDIIRGTGG